MGFLKKVGKSVKKAFKKSIKLTGKVTGISESGSTDDIHLTVKATAGFTKSSIEGYIAAGGTDVSKPADIDLTKDIYIKKNREEDSDNNDGINDSDDINNTENNGNNEDIEDIEDGDTRNNENGEIQQEIDHSKTFTINSNDKAKIINLTINFK